MGVGGPCLLHLVPTTLHHVPIHANPTPLPPLGISPFQTSEFFVSLILKF